MNIRTHNRNIVLLLSGQAISMAGDQLANVAFLWLITSLTGSAAALSIVMAVLAFFLFGAGMAGFGTAATTIIQQEIDQAYLGRVFSLYGLFALSLMPLGYFISSLLSSVLSTGTIIALAGIIMILTAFWLLMQCMSLRQSQMKGSSA